MPCCPAQVSHWGNTSSQAVAGSNMWVIITGALASLLMPCLLTMTLASYVTRLINLIPPFGLYSGLFELSQHSFVASYTDTDGLTFDSLKSSGTVMASLLVTFAVEAPVFLLIAYLSGTPSLSAPWQWLLRWRDCAPFASSQVGPSPEDVSADTDQASAFFQGRGAPGRYGIVVSNLTKVYSGSAMHSAPPPACDSLSLCVKRNECFGLLGPNGAGKQVQFNVICAVAVRLCPCAHLPQDSRPCLLLHGPV